MMNKKEIVIRADQEEELVCTISGTGATKKYDCKHKHEDIPDPDEFMKALDAGKLPPIPSFPPGMGPMITTSVGSFSDVIVKPKTLGTTVGNKITIPSKGNDIIVRCLSGTVAGKKVLACYSPEKIGEDMEMYIMGGSYSREGITPTPGSVSDIMKL